MCSSHSSFSFQKASFISEIDGGGGNDDDDDSGSNDDDDDDSDNEGEEGLALHKKHEKETEELVEKAFKNDFILKDLSYEVLIHHHSFVLDNI